MNTPTVPSSPSTDNDPAVEAITDHLAAILEELEGYDLEELAKGIVAHGKKAQSQSGTKLPRQAPPGDAASARYWSSVERMNAALGVADDAATIDHLTRLDGDVTPASALWRALAESGESNPVESVIGAIRRQLRLVMAAAFDGKNERNPDFADDELFSALCRLDFQAEAAEFLLQRVMRAGAL